MTFSVWSISLVSYIGFAAALNVMLLASPVPFFEREFHDIRQIDDTLVGFLFSVYPLGTFVVSPLTGLVLKTRRKREITVVIGLPFLAITTLIFIFCASYFWIELFLRCCQGVISAFVVSALYGLVVDYFENEQRDVAVAVVEVCCGMGFLLGAAIGGVLYDLGGLSLPFYVILTFCLLGSLLNFTLVPYLLKHHISSPSQLQESLLELNDTHSISEGDPLHQFDTTPLSCLQKLVYIYSQSYLVFFLALAPLVGLTVVTAQQGVVPTLLEDRFGLTPGRAGLCYAVSSISYALFAFAAAYLTRYIGRFLTLISGFASLLVALVIQLIAYFIAVESSTISFWAWTGIILGRFISGAGFALVNVPSLPIMFEVSRVAPSDEHTTGILTGVWNSAFALGEVVGPLLGLSLYSHFGFATVMLSLVGFICFYSGLILTFRYSPLSPPLSSL